VCGGLTAIVQKDLGSAIVVVSILLAMYFISQAKLRFFMLLVLIVFAGAILAIAVEPYRMQRVTTYISHLRSASNTEDLNQELSAEDYHVEQAVITLGSGGFLGRGLGKSYQTYGYLPQPADDSIFVVIGEQMGLIGSLILLSLYLLLIYRLIKISFRADSLEGRVMSMGIATWISIQVFVNIGAMIKLIPLTGVTLPLVSYGGSSVMLVLASIGLSQSISKFTLPKNYLNYQRRIK
jgi:cell division protein FtsW